MDEIKSKILNGALHLFMRYGIKSLTMDDISRELGISKKTLYLYVMDKDDLVNQAVIGHLSSEERECNDLLSHHHSPIGEMLEIIKWQFRNHGRMHQSALFDLKKYHPNSFNEFLSFKTRVIKPRLINNLKRGIASEVYHSDMNIEFTVQVYLHLIDITFSPDIMGFSNIGKIMFELIKYHLFSITSIKGRKQLVKELENFNKEIQQFI